MKLMVYDNYERLLANIDKMGQTDEHLGALQEHLSKTFKLTVIEVSKVFLIE